MNTYSDWKVYVFGRWVTEGHEDIPPYKKDWATLLKDPEFIEFRNKHEITDKQIGLIKKGFHLWDFPDYSKERIPESVMPFGIHKGKYFSQIPPDYWLFLNTQSWLEKWPSVKLHVRNLMSEIKENAATPEEIKELLKI